jgi:hypothetical protein
MAEGPIETAADLGDDESAVARRWITEIQMFEKDREPFNTRCKRIIRRYRDERDTNQAEQRRLNLLWSNVETLKPTVYAKTPKASVKRRFRDQDPVGRVASIILERSVDYFLSSDVSRFDSVMRSCRDDLLLCGIGVSWQRYVPHMRMVESAPTEDIAEEGYQIGDYQDDNGMDGAEQPEAVEMVEELEYEEVVDDYVYWSDFGHNSGARTWEEVYAVWRKAYLTRDELRERFPDCADHIPLDAKPKGMAEDSPQAEMFKKATVYEIWDKSSEKVYWIHAQYPEKPLDVREDPLKLQNFFPCPRPLFATMTSGTMTPVPDYAQYQDQAEEIDNLTQRINHLVKSLKVRGLYAGEISEIKRLFQDGDEGDLIPVENWAMFADKGGIQNAISWIPLKDIAQTAIQLYEARERAKQDLYEVTGLSDILRGSSDANETATAQSIKAQWGSVRVRDRQQEVARFARDVIRIKAEIISELFSPDTILKISNAESIPELKMNAMDPMTGQPVEQFNMELAMAALDLLKTDSTRNWRIDIEADSTIAADEQADKQSRVEFVTAVSQFVGNWAPILAQAPQLSTLAGDLLKFAVRGFKAGEELENTIEQTFEQIQQAAMAPKPPPQPDPTEVVKADAEKVRAQADMQDAQLQLQQTGIEAVMKQQEFAQQQAMAEQQMMMGQPGVIQ